MLPFTSQVQIASDNVKGAAGRLSGAEIPKFEDTEKSFPELQARIDKTIAFLDTLTEAQFEGADKRDIVLQLRDRKLDFKGADYLTLWAFPNIYFHITTAYALLRHGGVEIGKKDYLSGGAAQEELTKCHPARSRRTYPAMRRPCLGWVLRLRFAPRRMTARWFPMPAKTPIWTASHVRIRRSAGEICTTIVLRGFAPSCTKGWPAGADSRRTSRKHQA